MRILAIYGSLLLFVIFSLLNVYKSWRGTSLFEEIKRLLLAWLLVLIIFNVLLLLLSNEEQLAVLWPFCLFRVPVFIYWSIFVFIGLIFLRIFTKLVLYYFRKKGYNQRRAAIVGAGDAGRELAKIIRDDPGMGIDINGFFDDRLSEGSTVYQKDGDILSVIGSISICPELVLQKGIDIVFIALPMRAEEKINKLVWALGTKGVTVYILPDLFTLGIQKSKMHQLGDLNLMYFNLFPSWKRAFDIIFSLAVIIFTFPIWLLIIFLIKKEDQGSIFYNHPRVMETGKSFDCIKFRTMYTDADKKLKTILESDSDLKKEWDNTYKLKNDPRITKIGKLLRRTSLDELPQFINVLKGQMSVVGARPVVPEELEKYYKKTALTYCSTKPGVTGPWQVGRRSDTKDYGERVELDRWYVLNCTLWLDLKIIFKTILRVISPKGAY